MRVLTVVMTRLRERTYDSLLAASALSILISTLTLAASAAPASAYDKEWRCKAHSSEGCEFTEAGDVEQQKVKLEKGYNAYLCMGDEGLKGVLRGSACTEKEVEHGTTAAWNPGKTYSAYWPVYPWGLQENPGDTEGELWNWAWGA